MYMKYEHKMCAHSVWFRKKLWHKHTLWPKKEMLKKWTVTLSINIYTCAHKIWQCGLGLIALEENQIPSPCYSTQRSLTYTQTNTQYLVLHPKPSSKRFRSRRGNLNTEFHIFLGNVCPVHFGMCIHNLLLFIGAKLCNKTQLCQRWHHECG